MEPVKRGHYSRAHLEELLDEERAKTDSLHTALEQIKKHQEAVACTACEMSTTWYIADGALNGTLRKGKNA